MTKMTYAMAIDFATEIIKNGTADFHGFTADEYMEKLTALKNSLAKRNSSEHKPTKTQKENEILKGQILDAITKPMTASEVATQFGISNQKASALLNALVKDDKMSKTVGEKHKTFFEVV